MSARLKLKPCPDTDLYSNTKTIDVTAVTQIEI
jgi:hypothetical protein